MCAFMSRNRLNSAWHPEEESKVLPGMSNGKSNVVQACFLTVDLEIWASSKLDSVVAEMGDRVSVFFCGPAPKRQLLALENSRYYKNPDTAIHALCKVVEALSPSALRIWKAARKEFDVGYALRRSERSSRFSLRPDTLQRIAKLGGTLTVTYDRDDPDEENERKWSAVARKRPRWNVREHGQWQKKVSRGKVSRSDVALADSRAERIRPRR